MRLLPGNGRADDYERGWLDFACDVWKSFQEVHGPPESLGFNCLVIVLLIYPVFTRLGRDGVLILAFAWDFVLSFYDCS